VGLCRFRWWCLKKLVICYRCCYGVRWINVLSGKDWLFLGHDWQCDIWTRCGLLLALGSFAKLFAAIAKVIAPKKLRDKKAGEKLLR